MRGGNGEVITSPFWWGLGVEVDGVVTGVRVKAEWVVFWNGAVITPPYLWIEIID